MAFLIMSTTIAGRSQVTDLVFDDVDEVYGGIAVHNWAAITEVDVTISIDAVDLKKTERRTREP